MTSAGAVPSGPSQHLHAAAAPHAFALLPAGDIGPLECEALWQEYYEKRAQGLPCNPPDC